MTASPVSKQQTVIRPTPVYALPKLPKITIPAPQEPEEGSSAAGDEHKKILWNAVGPLSHPWNSVVPAQTSCEPVAMQLKTCGQDGFCTSSAQFNAPTVPSTAFQSAERMCESSYPEAQTPKPQNGTMLMEEIPTQILSNNLSQNSGEVATAGFGGALSSQHIMVDQLNCYLEQIRNIKARLSSKLDMIRSQQV